MMSKRDEGGVVPRRWRSGLRTGVGIASVCAVAYIGWPALAQTNAEASGSAPTAAGPASATAAPAVPAAPARPSQPMPPPQSVAVSDWSRPKRPVTVIEQINHCIDLTGPVDVRVQCYREAARLLEVGLQYQECLWGEPSTLQCGSPNDHELPPNAEGRDALRKLARELHQTLLRVTPKQVDSLAGDIRQMRKELSKLVARQRGRSTLVSQGGVSLGSWQAGLLFLVTEWEKRRVEERYEAQSKIAAELPPLPDGSPRTAEKVAAFPTVTGASAGAVNGLAAAVESCRWSLEGGALREQRRAARLDPQRSLYYRVWVETLGMFGRDGKAGLLPTPDMPSTRLGIFNEQGALGIALEEAARYIADGSVDAVPGCSVDLGFAVTHLHQVRAPVLVEDQGGVETPLVSRNTLRKKFAVNVRVSNECAVSNASASADAVTRAQGQLCLTNVQPGTAGDALSRLDERAYLAGLGEHQQQVSMHTLLRGITASGAFPVAFPPVDLAYTQYLPTANGQHKAQKAQATFVDGGTFDNTPIGLAAALDGWRPAHSSNPYLHDLLPTDPRTYIFVDPGVTSWQARSEPESKREQRGVVETLLAFAGDFISASSDAEFLDSARQLPFMRELKDNWVGSRLGLPRRRLPIAGDQLGHFMAFLEKDFRVFDFYVGLADASLFVHSEERLLANQTPISDALDQQLAAKDPLYRCIRAYYAAHHLDRSEHNPNLVGGPPPRTKLLSQASLPPECRATGATSSPDQWPLTEEEAGLIDRGSWDPYARLIAAAMEGRSPSVADERKLTAYNFRALLVAMHNYKVWTQDVAYDSDDAFDKFFSLLGEAPATRCDVADQCGPGGYVFVDLEAWRRNQDLIDLGGRMSIALAKTTFRRLAQTAIDRFSEPQSSVSKNVLRLGGRLAADAAIERSFPRHVLATGYADRGLEAAYGYGLTDGVSAHLRWDLGARVFRLGFAELDRDFSPFQATLATFTRLALVLPFTWVDVELAAAANAEQVWAPGALRDEPWPARSLGFGGALSGVVVQRLYLGVDFQYRPSDLIWTSDAYQDTAVAVIPSYALTGFAGWRSLW